MISIQNLSIHFTGQDLFTDINFLIREKDRIGLVGKNGAGKTTLIRIIAGLEQPSHGDVVMSDDVTIGYLPQEKNIHSEKTVLEETMTAFEEYHQIEKKLAQLQDELAQRTDYESDSYQKLCERMSALNERLTLIGGHSIEGEAEQILVGLGFDHEDMNRAMNEFSNGWQMRVELAKILLRKPKLLLLDEPTNHLDIESIQWLGNERISAMRKFGKLEDGSYVCQLTAEEVKKLHRREGVRKNRALSYASLSTTLAVWGSRVQVSFAPPVFKGAVAKPTVCGSPFHTNSKKNFPKPATTTLLQNKHT